ncbi:hypothetical protein SAMN05216582_14023 [Selenomonas ruminantium]|uniref:Uncharacterized protein n=1 Tax=Selenomonas ruminantium TaxID=971 RepID=A0A1M6XQ64_SELRU|nr:hypothetical protein SAMN05216582_14023 [Selenomonas ruminantium]
MLTPVICRRHFILLGKEFVEIGGVTVAATVDDLLDGKMAVGKVCAGFFQLQPLQELGKILTGILYQEPGHLSVTVREVLGQLVQGKLAAVVLQVMQYGDDGGVVFCRLGFSTISTISLAICMCGASILAI